MKKFILIIVTLIANFSSLGIAHDCSSQKTQMDINFCAKKEYKEIEKKLNILYSNFLENLDEKEKEKFNFAEAKWAEYRDAQCDAEIYKYKGGSILPFIKYQCLITITEYQIEIIRFLYGNQ